jgi:hypothetical protein
MAKGEALQVKERDKNTARNKLTTKRERKIKDYSHGILTEYPG